MNICNTDVRTENIKAGFDGKILFQGLDLSIEKGEFIIINGENGTGKTTLIKMLLGLLHPLEGRVFVLGNEVGTAAWKKTRRSVAYVNQHAVASDFPISAREVVEIGTVELDASKEEKKHLVDEAMRTTNCFHLTHAPYTVLSGGEKQRVSIARCLCQKPSILMLDEPAAYLDRQSKIDLMLLLKKLNEEQGITIIMVSHELQNANVKGVRTLSIENNAVSAEEKESRE